MGFSVPAARSERATTRAPEHKIFSRDPETQPRFSTWEIAVVDEKLCKQVSG